MKITVNLIFYILLLLVFFYLTIVGILIKDPRQSMVFFVLSLLMGYILGQEIQSCREAHKEQRRMETGGPLDNPNDF